MNEEISKSQDKRDAQALLQLAERLSQLSIKQLRQIALPPEVFSALEAMLALKSFNARKRHLQYVARLLRQSEVLDDIESSYDTVINQSQLNTAEFLQLERWRSRLMSDDDVNALTEFVQLTHCDEVQALRVAIRRAKAERDQQKNPGASKALFRLIREWLR